MSFVAIVMASLVFGALDVCDINSFLGMKLSSDEPSGTVASASET